MHGTSTSFTLLAATSKSWQPRQKPHAELPSHLKLVEKREGETSSGQCPMLRECSQPDKDRKSTRPTHMSCHTIRDCSQSESPKDPDHNQRPRMLVVKSFKLHFTTIKSNNNRMILFYLCSMI